MKFVTGDQHFNHEGIIEKCVRPFRNLWAMNAQMIRCWNEVVKPNDVVYALGDLIWHKTGGFTTPAAGILKQLKGHIIYIPSLEWTHEKAVVKLGEERFDKIIPLLAVKVQIGSEKAYITFCHYRMAIWPKSHYNSWHCYAHSHNRGESIGKSLDIGVDGHDFYPWSFDEIADYMKKRPDNINYIGEKQCG